MTGDETGAFGGEEYGGAYKFIKLAEAVHGCTQKKFPATFGTIEQLSVKFSAKHSGGNSIYADTMAGPFNG